MIDPDYVVVVVVLDTLVETYRKVPEAFEPRTSAAGNTSIGWPPSRHWTERATPASLTRVARRLSPKVSRNERTLDAVKPRSMLGPATDVVMSEILLEDHRNVNLRGIEPAEEAKLRG